MRRSLLVSLLSLALPLSAAITGTVLGPGGAPVAKARVAAYRSEPLIAMVRRLNSGAPRTPLASATTDDAGAFKLEAGTGVVELTIESEGLSPESMHVPADEQAVSINMRKAAMSDGTVTANGKPVEGVRVLSTNQFTFHELGKSDAAGHFRVSDVMDGVLFVHPDFAPGKSPALDRGIAVHGKVLDEHDRPVANAAVIADGVSLAMTADDGTFALPHVRRGAPMQVESDRAGANAIAGSAELVVHLKPLLKISGVVRDESKNPLAGVTVLALNSGQWMQLAVSDAKGAFTANVPAGTHWLMTVGGPYFERMTTLVAAGSTHDITLKRLVTVDGIVRDDEGKPVTGARVMFKADREREEELVFVQSDGVPTTAAGRFRVRIVPGTKGHFVATKPAMPTAESDSMTVAAGGARDVVVTMPRGLEVKGTVTDSRGHPIGGAAIRRPSDLMRPFDSVAEEWATTAQDGTFSVHLAGGANELTFAKKGFVKTTEELDVRPDIRPVTVAMKEAATVRGTLVNKDGTPAGSLPIGEPKVNVLTMTSADGTFALDFPEAGTYTIEAGYNSRRLNVTAPSSDVRLVLDAGFTIHGHVTDAETGAPVEQFTPIGERREGAVNSYFGELQGEPGDFVMNGLDPGPVTIVVTAPHYLPARVNAEAEQSQPVAVALHHGLTMHGRVHDAAGQAIEGVEVTRNGSMPTEHAVSPTSGADGTFEIDAVAPDETVVLTFSKPNYISREQKVEASNANTPIDVVLTRGLTIKGHVVDAAGKPVPEVPVIATTATYGGTSLNATTDAAGAFAFGGALPGHYDFTAGEEGSASRALLRDVDVEHVRDVTIVIEHHPSGTIEGRVAGLPPSTLFLMLNVDTADGSITGTIKPDGTFRVEDVPVGMAKVEAVVGGTNSARRTRAVSVDITAGAVAHVELGLKEPKTLRGRVTRNGQPVPHVDVSLESNSYGSAHAATGEDGSYEIHADAGSYRVDVEGLPYHGEVDLEQTAVFDIDFNSAFARALVVDAATGLPIEGADVEVIDMRLEARTTPDGRVAIEVPRGGKLVLLASKAGYANATAEATEGEVVMKLARSAGAVVRIVDARDGRTLSGYAVARDAAGHVIASAHQQDADGTSSLAVPPGEYRFSASADGYGSETMRAAVPSGEIRIALPRGGKLLLRSNQDVHGTARLLLPDGDVYVRCWCNGVAEIELDGRMTTVEAVSPGSYTLEVTPSGGKARRFPVTVIQGETVPVQID